VARVSVITIFLNAERFLAEAVESVLAQDFRDFELLLVDDGSTDSSTAIARDYTDRHPDKIRYLEHPGHANRGMSASRNLGLAAARGELVAFIDADDRWRPHKLREQVELLERMPEVDAICGSANYWASADGGEDRIVASGHVRGRVIRPLEATLALYPLGEAAPPCPSDLLVRRTAIEAVGGFEESFTGPLQLYEDQAFLSKFYLEKSFYFSDQVWLDYRLHDESCDSRVRGAGQYHAVRRHFLEWFDAYVAAGPHRNRLALRMKIARALLPYRHPRLAAVLRSAKSLVLQLAGR
jgi:glycosyltransferase involved in cell wall biosynthesis